MDAFWIRVGATDEARITVDGVEVETTRQVRERTRESMVERKREWKKTERGRGRERERYILF